MRIIGSLFCAFFLAMDIWLAVLVATPLPPEAVLENSVVIVSDDASGHGSGVYIGNGNFITAAHVVADTDGQITVKQGTTEVPVAVVWFDKTTDTALLHSDYIKLSPASLACGTPDVVVGDSLEAIGNPMDLIGIHTWGKVARNVYTVHEEGGPLDGAQVFVGDITIAPGNSGGPVFHDGAIAGITNAMVMVPLSQFSGALVPLTFVVPRSVICKQLLAKHQAPQFKHEETK